MKKFIVILVLLCSAAAFGDATYTLPTVGASTNTWGTGLNNYLTAVKVGINVKEYGAVGDGDTDDTVALQAAIDASEWKSLYIPSGKYKITSALELDGQKGYNIYGDGWDIRASNSGSIIKNAGTGNAINITTAGTGTSAVDQEVNLIHLSNFMILGTYVADGGADSGRGIAARNVHSLFLDRMVIKSNGDSGIVATNCYGLKVTNSIISLNGNHGINIVNRGNAITIQGCYINGNARNDGSYANLQFAMTGSAGSDENLGSFVIGNDISSPGDGDAHTAYNVIVQNTLSLAFIGNYVEKNESDGQLFNGASTCRNLVIDGNYFQDGDFLLNKCLKSRVTNNTFRKVSVDTVMTITADAGDGNNYVRGNRLVGGATETFTAFVPFPRGQLGDTSTWDPASIASGASLDSANITVTGAALGDIAMASLKVDLVGLSLTAAVTATNTVVCTLVNNTGGAVNLASSDLTVRVFQIAQPDDPA